MSALLKASRAAAGSLGGLSGRPITFERISQSGLAGSSHANTTLFRDVGRTDGSLRSSSDITHIIAGCRIRNIRGKRKALHGDTANLGSERGIQRSEPSAFNKDLAQLLNSRLAIFYFEVGADSMVHRYEVRTVVRQVFGNTGCGSI